MGSHCDILTFLQTGPHSHLSGLHYSYYESILLFPFPWSLWQTDSYFIINSQSPSLFRTPLWLSAETFLPCQDSADLIPLLNHWYPPLLLLLLYARSFTLTVPHAFQSLWLSNADLQISFAWKDQRTLWYFPCGFPMFSLLRHSPYHWKMPESCIRAMALQGFHNSFC